MKMRYSAVDLKKCPQLVSVLLCSILIFVGSTSAKEWRGIIPLHSTRADVIRILGQPTIDDYIYDVEEGRINIMYAQKSCHQGLPSKWGNWNVAKDTVIHITLHLKNPIPVAELRLDMEKYRWYTDDSNHTYYHDPKEGIDYSVYEGKVKTIVYGPTEKDEHLLCKKGLPKIKY